MVDMVARLSNYGQVGSHTNDLVKTNDTNGNGSLSFDEFMKTSPNDANADKVFGNIDTDGDGALSAAELTKAYYHVKTQSMDAGLMKSKDIDGSGTISASEIGLPDQLFGDMDADGNGSLDTGEIEQNNPFYEALSNQFKSIQESLSQSQQVMPTLNVAA